MEEKLGSEKVYINKEVVEWSQFTEIDSTQEDTPTCGINEVLVNNTENVPNKTQEVLDNEVSSRKIKQPKVEHDHDKKINLEGDSCEYGKEDENGYKTVDLEDSHNQVKNTNNDGNQNEKYNEESWQTETAKISDPSPTSQKDSNGSVVTKKGTGTRLRRAEHQSGVPGVYWQESSQRWIAQWSDSISGRRITHGFSARVYGFEDAKQMAIKSRVDAIENGKATARKLHETSLTNKMYIANKNFSNVHSGESGGLSGSVLTPQPYDYVRHFRNSKYSSLEKPDFSNKDEKVAVPNTIEKRSIQSIVNNMSDEGIGLLLEEMKHLKEDTEHEGIFWHPINKVWIGVWLDSMTHETCTQSFTHEVGDDGVDISRLKAIEWRLKLINEKKLRDNVVEYVNNKEFKYHGCFPGSSIYFNNANALNSGYLLNQLNSGIINTINSGSSYPSICQTNPQSLNSSENNYKMFNQLVYLLNGTYNGGNCNASGNNGNLNYSMQIGMNSNQLNSMLTNYLSGFYGNMSKCRTFGDVSENNTNFSAQNYPASSHIFATNYNENTLKNKIMNNILYYNQSNNLGSFPNLSGHYFGNIFNISPNIGSNLGGFALNSGSSISTIGNGNSGCNVSNGHLLNQNTFLLQSLLNYGKEVPHSLNFYNSLQTDGFEPFQNASMSSSENMEVNHQQNSSTDLDINGMIKKIISQENEVDLGLQKDPNMSELIVGLEKADSLGDEEVHFQDMNEILNPFEIPTSENKSMAESKQISRSVTSSSPSSSISSNSTNMSTMKDSSNLDISESTSATVSSTPVSSSSKVKLVTPKKKSPSGVSYKSGIPGVYWKTRDQEWVAEWYDQNRKRHSRHFYVKKYGFNEAKKLAIQCRLNAVNSGEAVLRSGTNSSNSGIGCNSNDSDKIIISMYHDCERSGESEREEEGEEEEALDEAIPSNI
ncbi:transcription factor with AP2 domain(s) [Cryptosporidium felis]|nr:transcription factor with AP2 domain(s) [Cryptosporidium felis]